VALTWILMATAGIPAGRVRGLPVRVFRTMFVRAFLSHFDRESVPRVLPAVVQWKSRDRNVLPDELAAMQRLAARIR
jgi:hypothetical protein